ncbi:MAG: S-layer homology domain-containing protein [Acutalibacteraceae bacterium]
MKTVKKILAVILTLMMLSGALTCFAVELNTDAANAHYGQYNHYLLLGDSSASGYRDVMSDKDNAYNKKYNQTTYYRVPGSYGDIIANAIVEDKSMTAFAGPGFRTTEVRYMLEDEFAANCTDPYLFHPSQLYVYKKYGYLPGDERIRQAYKDAVANADLISIGIGGNDWGEYLVWVLSDVLEKENVADKYIKMVEDLLDDDFFDENVVEKVVEIAHIAGALPELLTAVPTALKEGVSTFYNNWDIMIQDFYDLNPDVTLMVVGLGDQSYKGKNYDYDGVVGEPVETEEKSEIEKAATAKINEIILSLANKPMIEGAEKFGYIYVDPSGATYVDCHPDADGHMFIANKIIEALPDKDIYDMFTDVTPGHKYYKEIEYVVKNGYMFSTSENTFSPDEVLTNAELSKALSAITGDYEITDNTDKVTKITFAFTMFSNVKQKGFAAWLKAFILTVRTAFGSFGDITRAEAARGIYEYTNI